jgi:hypothetical protein
MRIAYAASLVVLASLFGPTDESRAQSARRGPYYGRTTTTRGRAGMALERGIGSSLEQTSATPSQGDPLRPYSSKPVGTSSSYSSEPRPTPSPRPLPRPVARNFFPTARIGQSVNSNMTPAGRRHCTPSRAGSLGR